MKVKNGFRLRSICGENVIVAEGLENIDFSKIISLNKSAAYLWRKAEALPAFTADDMKAWLLEEYEIDEATAQADAQAVAQQWIQAGITME